MASMWFWICGWLLVFVTVIGNGLVIFLVATRSCLHTSANRFILSLAVADLCCGLSFFPPMFGAEFGFYTIDLTHAGVFFKVSFTFFYCSNASVCAMAVDRLLAITKPLRYVSLMTTETIRILIFAAWMAPLLLFGIPSIFMYRDNPGFTMFVEISRVIIFQISPVVMFVIATCHLLRLALKSNRKTNVLLSQVRFNHASGEIIIKGPPPRKHARASTVLIVLIMTFFNVTYLGGNYRCICLLTDVCPFTGTLSYIIHLVLIANSAVNPIFYSFFKKDIRRELRCMFSS